MNADNTIITWMDQDIGTDVALSFQEEAGCSAIWDNIQATAPPHGPSQQSPSPSTADDNRTAGSPQGSLMPANAGAVGGEPPRGTSVCIKLPWPEVRLLPDIHKALADVPIGQRERVAMNIYSEGHYLPRLLEVFRECEDREDTAALCHLYGIAKCLIMMNNMQLVEQMVSEPCFWDVLGCLEYDPDLSPNKAEHRHFLRV
jgi:protein phosphatase 4 regulatory subunit 3